MCGHYWDPSLSLSPVNPAVLLPNDSVSAIAFGSTYNNVLTLQGNVAEGSYDLLDIALTVAGNGSLQLFVNGRPVVLLAQAITVLPAAVSAETSFVSVTGASSDIDISSRRVHLLI